MNEVIAIDGKDSAQRALAESKGEQIMRFWAFCVEQFKHRHGLFGASVGVLFSQNGIFKFLADNFEVEHILGSEQIIDDIDTILRRKEAMP